MLIQFRLAHVREMHEIASAEDIMKECQVRETEHFEVYSEQDAFEEAKEELKVWKAAMPEAAEGFTAVDGDEAVEASRVCCITAFTDVLAEILSVAKDRGMHSRTWRRDASVPICDVAAINTVGSTFRLVCTHGISSNQSIER